MELEGVVVFGGDRTASTSTISTVTVTVTVAAAAFGGVEDVDGWTEGVGGLAGDEQAAGRSMQEDIGEFAGVGIEVEHFVTNSKWKSGRETWSRLLSVAVVPPADMVM